MKSCRYKVFDLNKGQLLVLKVFPLTPPPYFLPNFQHPC